VKYSNNIDWVDLLIKVLTGFGTAIGAWFGRWLLARLRSNHVIGIVAIAAGEGGVGLTGAVLYVWCVIVIPANVVIASRLPLANALYLYAGLGLAAVIFSLVGAISILSNCFGICKLAPYSSAAKLIRRYVFRRPMRRRFPAASVV